MLLAKQKSSAMATNPVPRIFVAFRRNDSGPDERKMATSGAAFRYISRALYTEACHVRDAFMRECAVRFPPFFIFFILFFSDGRASIHRPRACRTWIFSRLFSSDDRYSVRHRVKYKSHRELEYTKRDVLKSVASRLPSFQNVLFSNVRSQWSAHVYRAADSVVGRFCAGIMLNI